MSEHSSIVQPLNTGESLKVEHQMDHDDHSHGGLGKYIAVFVALCLLTSASFLTLSSYWPWPGPEHKHVTWSFMMAVSCTKAMLVILFFMHVKYEANWKYVLTIPAGMMSVFLILMLIPDVGLRGRSATPERRAYMATDADKLYRPAHTALKTLIRLSPPTTISHRINHHEKVTPLSRESKVARQQNCLASPTREYFMQRMLDNGDRVTDSV